MRFIDQTSGTAFDPASTAWPEKACVVERFVSLRIHLEDNHVVAEEPRLVWNYSDFLEVAKDGNELKRLLAKAINVINEKDEFDTSSKLRYATWRSEDGKSMFQLAYSDD